MKSEWLQKILLNLNDLYTSDWATDLYKRASKNTFYTLGREFRDDYYNKILLINFENELKTFEDLYLRQQFELLHFSIISGECFHSNYTDIVTKAIEISGEFQISNFNINLLEQTQLSLENKIQELEPLSILKKCLIEYKSNSNFLLRLVENPTLNTLFDLSDQTDDILSDLKRKHKNKSDLKEELLISIKNNLYLFRKDFTLKYNLDEVEKLLISKHEIIKCQKYFSAEPVFFEILDILKEKNIFLIRKFIIRKIREENTINENYVFLGNVNTFDFDSHKLNNQIFKDWDKYSEIHFSSENNKSNENIIRKKSIETLRRGKLSSIDFHLLTKYFKDLDIDKKELNKLLENIEDIPFDDINFDFYSKNKIKNYISNNIFSRSIDDLNINLEIIHIERLIEKEIEEVRSLQKESFLNNFFPYYKVSFFLKLYIEEHRKLISIKNNNSLEEIKNIENSSKLLSKYYNEFKNKLCWSKIHLNYAFQQPFNECLSAEISINNSYKINVFCSSTFSTPIDYEFYERFIKDMDAFELGVKNDLINLSHLYNLVSYFQNSKEKIDNEIKDNSKRNIELLGIFSAIIALLFQGAYAINSEVKFEDKLFTLITMFLVLISFMLMLRSFYSKKFESDELKTIKIVSFLVIPILLIATVILFKIFK